MKTPPMDHAAAVTKGIAWLDIHKPGWMEDVHPAGLCMSSRFRCILGQVYGDYSNIVDDHDPTNMLLTWDQTCELGFSLDITTFSPEWDRLGEEWKKRITARSIPS